MKGIKKLFYGLVFMALISVGFKIEAKAAVSITVNTPDFSTESGKLIYYFNLEEGDFPTFTTTDTTVAHWVTYTYSYTLKDQAGNTVSAIRDESGNLIQSSNWKVVLKTERPAGATDTFNKSISINGAAFVTVPPVVSQNQLCYVNREDTRTAIVTKDTAGVGTKSRDFTLTATPVVEKDADSVTPTNVPTNKSAVKTVTVGQVLGGAYCGDPKIANISCNGTEVTSAGVYLFAGETATFTTPTLSTDYQYLKWETTQGTLADSAR